MIWQCNFHIPTNMMLSNSAQNEFIAAFFNVSTEVNRIAKSKGWWDEERNDGEIIALMHSELSEGLEYLRNKVKLSDHIPFTGIEEELADVIIRIMDYGVARKLDIARALLSKINFNESREHKHGGKKF